MIDRYKDDLTWDGIKLIKKGKWIHTNVPKMWTDGNNLYVIDPDSRHVLFLSSCSCWVGESSGFRLEYHNQKDPHSNDIGTFFYIPKKKAWTFAQW